jgi:small subunit ribosomal protein S20
MKRLRAAIQRNDKQAAQDSLKQVISQIDRAVSKGVYHRKTGSRYVARLSTQVSKLAVSTAA